METVLNDEQMKKNYIKNIQKYIINNFGNSIDDASERQVYQAILEVTKEILSLKRYKHIKRVRENEQKRVYYLSMEFLVGKTLRNNLFNLGLEKELKDFLKEKGYFLDDIYDLEPDPGLGNGGLGRLASCYMDAMTALEYPITGFSILYEFGIFKQVIFNGCQAEFPDNWLNMGKYNLQHRQDQDVEVHFYGNIIENWTNNGLHIKHVNYTSVIAEPYDLFISGYKSDAVNILRLWNSKSKKQFDISKFEQGEYTGISDSEKIAASIAKLLYPADNKREGKELRIKQQYFFVSASLQCVLKEHYNKYKTLDNLSEKAVFHINDTHPSLCIPEMMRILMDIYKYSWENAWKIVTSCCAYTNHTIMSEALEKWPIDIFQPILPRIFSIIKEINNRFCKYCMENNVGSDLDKMSIIHNNMIRMANLAIVGSFKVNGVSKLHTEILKDSTFKEFYNLDKSKIVNITNGIAHRRWLGQANPELTSYLNNLIGVNFINDLSEIDKLSKYADDKKVLRDLNEIKNVKKHQLAEYIKNANGITVNPYSIFDVQVKRLHEYKRQLLNAMHIVYLYNQIKNHGLRPTPRTFIFAAKASSGYYMAKKIIQFIYALSTMIEKDVLVRDYIKVVFLADYKVSLAEIIIPGANISEQISQAGKEASGTGNMKLMLNGAVTLGTLDGANVEILNAVGKENIFIFGLDKQGVNDLYFNEYRSKDFYNKSQDLRETMDFIKNFKFEGVDFIDIYNDLMNVDTYMNLADFDSYIQKQKEVENVYNDKIHFAKMSLINIAKSGIFSADRSVSEYVDKIWKIDKRK